MSFATAQKQDSRTRDGRTRAAPADRRQSEFADHRSLRWSHARDLSLRYRISVFQAEQDGIKNFSLFCNYITIVTTLNAILEWGELQLDGFIGPGHASMLIGTTPYEFIAQQYKNPIVVAGFELLGVLHSIYMLLLQLTEGRCEVQNQYARVVPSEGNAMAMEAVARVFELCEHFEWRGLGSNRALRPADASGVCRL